MQRRAAIITALRTPVGRHGGALASVRPDDLAAHIIKAVVERSGIDPALIEDVYFGAANQAGEDNRNVARMAALLAGLPASVPGSTVNRLCASGLEAVNIAARMIEAGHGDVFIAGGVESMSRAPYVLSKAESAFDRSQQIFDTSIGWRLVNPRMAALHHPFSMGETAENVARQHKISRADQDQFALQSQQRWSAAHQGGLFAQEIVPVEIPQRKGTPTLVSQRELGIDKAKLNVNGGAIAIGHPLGCSGARLATTLIHQMARSGASRGIASLCVGVGQGLATVFERE